MSRKFKIRDQEAVHFVTFTTIHWLDIFVRAEYRDIFLDSIRYCQNNKGIEVYAYCIMSSHVHIIIARHGPQQLEHVIRDYIHRNPVVAGIVRYPEDYLYSSAGNYAKLKENLLEVMLI